MTTYINCPGCGNDTTDPIRVTIHHCDEGGEVLIRTGRMCRGCSGDGTTAGRLLFPAPQRTPQDEATQHAQLCALQAATSIYAADSYEEAYQAVVTALTCAFDSPHTEAAAEGVADELLHTLIQGIAAPWELVGSTPGDVVSDMADMLHDASTNAGRTPDRNVPF